MNTIKLVDYDLVKEIRCYDRVLILAGIVGIIFWKKLRNLEKTVADQGLVINAYKTRYEANYKSYKEDFAKED